jgi:predicted transcriptional regulator
LANDGEALGNSMVRRTIFKGRLPDEARVGSAVSSHMTATRARFGKSPSPLPQGAKSLIDGTARRWNLSVMIVPSPDRKQPTSYEVPMTESADRLLAATIRIVTAWLAANSITSGALPGLIRDIHRTLTSLEPDRVREEPKEFRSAKAPSGPRTAVSIRKSIFADHLVCLEDGKHVLMLKRHLRTEHGLTPEQYRAKWSLPSNYPMVAPDYAKVRSGLAKAAGLGRRGRPRI